MMKIRSGAGREVPEWRSGSGCDGDWVAAIWMNQRKISSEMAPEYTSRYQNSKHFFPYSYIASEIIKNKWVESLLEWSRTLAMFVFQLFFYKKKILLKIKNVI